MKLESLSARALSVPLRDPFVIATGRVESTRSALVVARGGKFAGLGEAAALPPVTREDQDDLLRNVESMSAELIGMSLDGTLDVAGALSGWRNRAPVTCAGVESALLDLVARTHGLTARALLGGDVGATTRTLSTDITLPILGPQRMAALAREWWARGFRCFKVKVGKDLDEDLRSLAAIARATPEARMRIDANAGFSAKDAIALARAVAKLGLTMDCYEQPCAKDDLDAMAEVSAALEVPVIADESVASLEDLARVQRAKAADGINLKLAKSGGPVAAFEIGRAAKRAGMPLMFGGMVETRLGMSAAAHVACALGGVEFVDLDTAWLLEGDPFEGGYDADGPSYTMVGDAGFGVRERACDAGNTRDARDARDQSPR